MIFKSDSITIGLRTIFFFVRVYFLVILEFLITKETSFSFQIVTGFNVRYNLRKFMLKLMHVNQFFLKKKKR